MEANSKRNFLYLGSTILLILLVVGVSYAAFTFSGTGTKENVITTGHIEVAFEEQNNIVIKDRYPESDTEGLANTDENSSMSFTVSGDVAGSTIVNYAVGITEIKQGLNLTQDYIKINLTKNGSPATGFTSDTGKTIGSFKLIQVKGYLSSHVIAQGSITGVQVDTYTLKAWIDENYDLPLTYTENNASHNVTTQKESFSFKVKVVATDTTLETSEKEPNIPNAPELATNMIPIVYNESEDTWVKADSTNQDGSWYNYDSKVWANAVTVTEQNRSTYLNAKVGTPISMDDINTMWVWIPRFNATIDGTFCSEIDNVNTDDYPECYSKIVDLTEEEITTAVDSVYLLFKLQGNEMTKEEIRTMFEDALAENDQSTLDQMLNIYSGTLMLQHFSSYVTISSEDRLLINEITGSDTLPQEYIDGGFSAYLFFMLFQQGNTTTSNITIPSNDKIVRIGCETDGKTTSECDSYINELNGKDNSEKISYLQSLSENEDVYNYFVNKAENIGYTFSYGDNNVVENPNPVVQEGYCVSDTLGAHKVLDQYTNKLDCDAVAGADNIYWVIPNPKAINIRFTKTNEVSHDAFTFGEEELSGIWFAKFETSSFERKEASQEFLLGCTTETCENAKSIEILPNKLSLLHYSVSELFYAGRSIEQSDNLYGLVSEEVDTHMSKTDEWGAVSYLTHSIYGRCTSSTNCTEVGTNNNSSYITGYGAPAGSDSTVANGPYETSLGMGASTTGNIYGVYDMNGGNLEKVMMVYTDGSKLWSGNEYIDSGFNGCLGDSCSSQKQDGLPFPEEKYYNTYTSREDYIENGLQYAMVETEGWYNSYYEFPSNTHPWLVKDGLPFGSFFASNSFAGGSSEDMGSFRPVLVK